MRIASQENIKINTNKMIQEKLHKQWLSNERQLDGAH